MKKTSQDFLELLFNPDEEICVSYNQYGYHSVKQTDLGGDIVLKSPSDKVDDETINEYDINLIAMNPITGFRSDKNVTGLRTFLVEMDDGSIESQREYIKSMGMPYSVCVFSGNKSLHYGITVDEDFINIAQWRTLAQWILNIMSLADPMTKNPSRSIRFPDNIRKDGKQLKQGLVELKGRIPRDELLIWVHKYPQCKPKPKKDVYAERADIPVVSEGDMPDWLYYKLRDGVVYERNGTWFKYGCAMANQGFDIHQTIELFNKFYVEEMDFNREEWINCIESAFRTVNNS